MTVPWSKGSVEQRRAVKLLKILGPLALLVPIVAGVLGAGTGWVFLIGGIFLLPVGLVASKAESETAKKDAEVSAFFRSLGGTATSQGTTLGQALQSMELNSFPTLRPHVQTLSLRLKAGAKPETCWRLFGAETGSLLIDQAASMFFDATNLGGDAEQSGVLCSLFTNRVSMLRARRRGVAGTFGWLTLTMHTVITALLFFILEILRKFIELMQSAANFEMQEESMREMALSMMSFSTPQTGFLEQLALALIVLMALTNAFAMVASEGSSLIKITFYAAIMLFISGFGILVIPSVIGTVL
jgi:archaellum biogenesis protein FlaJ (TadC family)